MQKESVNVRRRLVDIPDKVVMVDNHSKELHSRVDSQTQGGQPGQPKPAPTFGNRPDFRNNTNNTANRPNFRNSKPGAPSGGPKEEPTEKEIQDQIKATLARLSGAGKSGKFAQRAKLRRQKRDDVAMSADEAAMEQELQSKVLKGYGICNGK